MQAYECVFITCSSLGENEVESLITGLCSGLFQIGGKVLKKERWGFLDLAYKIKRNSKGYYFMLIIECSHEMLKEFERKLKLNELVIRYLFLQMERRKLKLCDDIISLKLSA